ncbi:glycosyltransferase family 39 protein [Luteimonas vadosa]|uniref:Glycosyltransferase family 39 protein n=1 Tax=Luteimonas vadosa TaxID=1165507 RepID=A0ABP9E0X6_9GAMM
MRKPVATFPDARAWFVALWVLLTAAKVAVAAHLPLFVDEAFYWQESRHLAWAYSDLPGLTAWLIRLGGLAFGDGVLAVRLPFLMIAACLPWLVAGIAARESEHGDPRHAWLAATATLLLPLAGTLGVLALPDVTLALATLLCVDAATRLLRGVSDGAALELALGLAIGALSHYRFIAVIGVGFVALLLLPRARVVLRDPRVWIAIAFGAAAWTPLMAWNFENAEAGLRFQLVDRHPWSWQPAGVWFVLVQAVLVTPLLFVALLWSGARELRDGTESRRLLAWLGGLVILGFFVLGFFADTQRVSFHWPLPGYLALLPLLPAALARWPRPWRAATWAVAATGLLCALAYYAFVSVPSARAQSAALKWYPANFAGWESLADAVREERAAMPGDTRIVADNFKIGAELGFALDDPRIQVLDHPLNRAHGRAPQLRLWGLETAGREDWDEKPVLLVVGATDVAYKFLLQRYKALCRRVGPLPPPRVVNIDHGRTRYLLFALLPGRETSAGCVAPAMAWIDAPQPGATVAGRFELSGWAFKEGVGIDRVEVLIDGEVVAEAEYGLPDPGVVAFWGGSSDPGQPDVGFHATVSTRGVPSGRRWLGLRLHGRDGSLEDWSEQPIEVE